MMQEWYINKMIKAHNAKQWEDRRNYALAAKIDLVKYFYMSGDGAH